MTRKWPLGPPASAAASPSRRAPVPAGGSVLSRQCGGMLQDVQGGLKLAAQSRPRDREGLPSRSGRVREHRRRVGGTHGGPGTPAPFQQRRVVGGQVEPVRPSQACHVVLVHTVDAGHGQLCGGRGDSMPGLPARDLLPPGQDRPVPQGGVGIGDDPGVAAVRESQRCPQARQGMLRGSVGEVTARPSRRLLDAAFVSSLRHASCVTGPSHALGRVSRAHANCRAGLPVSRALSSSMHPLWSGALRGCAARILCLGPTRQFVADLAPSPVSALCSVIPATRC